MTFTLGMKAALTHTVKSSDLASSWQNDMPVLATPILLWLAEITCMRAVESTLERGEMTLGCQHQISHLAPTPEGWIVTFTAELVAVDGKMLTFDIAAQDGADRVLSGQHTRAVVSRDRFIDRVRRKDALRRPGSELPGTCTDVASARTRQLRPLRLQMQPR